MQARGARRSAHRAGPGLDRGRVLRRRHPRAVRRRADVGIERARLRHARVPGRGDRQQRRRGCARVQTRRAMNSADERASSVDGTRSNRALSCGSSSSWWRCSASASRWCRSTTRSARRPACATSRSPTRSGNTQVDATRTVTHRARRQPEQAAVALPAADAGRQRASGRADAGDLRGREHEPIGR